MENGKWASIQHCTVRFSGGRARVGPVTMGQANMRRCVLSDEPSSINARIIVPSPAGATLGQVAEFIRVLMLRHEGLRTTLPADPGTTQSVAAEGEITVSVHESGGAAEEHDCALEVAGRIRNVRFDTAHELPIRAAVILTGGVPSWVAFVLSHVAVDTIGQHLFRQEWAALSAGAELPPPAAMQPVDLAEWEQSPVGRRRLAAALPYWRDLMRTAPQAMFAAPGVGPSDWILPRLEVRSRAAAPALARVATRTGASPGTVVLAGLCALLAHRLSVRTAVVAMVAANRYLPELTDYFGTIAQDALLVADLDVATFDQLVGRVRDRSLAAYRRSHFDPHELWQVITKAGQERGTLWARDCVFSDPTGLTTAGLVSAGAPGNAPDGYDPGGPDLQLTWDREQWVPARLMLTTDRLDGEVEFSVWAEPQCLSAAEVEQFASALVHLIIAAAGRDVPLAEVGALAGFQPVERGAGWYLIDSCWIELDAVRRVLSHALDGLPCHVLAVPDEALGHRLECYVAPGARELSPEQVHAGCVAALNLSSSAMAPHWYTLCARAPADPTDAAQWQAQEPLASGSGRAPSPVTVGA